MGYYTVHDIDENSDEVVQALIDVSGYGDGLKDESVKWYSCFDDMKRVSKMFPDTLIKVRGEGEDAGDIWEAYAKNGKIQVEKAVITTAPFDESKLK